ncbi:TSC22 domain family protein 1 isoform X2 [Microplitis mediator]|uniref:TSC22 domain family protein 1 isoform X2 n=1 Tax=Microplitis mediator TaxID=375433 RepID=UPI0025530D09|nr:TSC22 domain family protein 1 isoform X2 [Microplitis mediator]
MFAVKNKMDDDDNRGFEKPDILYYWLQLNTPYWIVKLLQRLMTVASTSTPSPPVSPSANDMDWFAGVAEEELLYYTNNDVDSLWAVIGSFVPPPPRPPFLPEERIATDGLTTCDLCTWALRNDRHSSFSLDGTLAPGEFGWVLTLIIVSLISAAIGAVIMVTLLHCRRMKSAGGRASCCGVGVEDANPQEPVSPGAVGVAGGVSVIPERPPLELDKLPPYHDVTPTPGHNVWSWLGSRRGGGAAGVVATPLSLPPHRCAMNLPVENHYTHMQTDEALYAELDSQTASYASDLQLQLRGSSTYGGRATTPGDEEEDEYHELDAARLHRRYSGDSQNGTLKERRHNQRLQEPDYEMYENGPSTPLSLNRHPNHQHHLQHHHHHHHHLQGLRTTSTASEVNPSYQNTGYTGSDADLDGPFLSSAPSSAYYSDLSSNSANNQQQQQSSGVTLPASITAQTQTATSNLTCHQATATTEPQYRLAAITETTTPSDYI